MYIVQVSFRTINPKVTIVDENGDPLDLDVQVTRTGPGGQSQTTVRASATLSNLAPGGYTLSAASPAGFECEDAKTVTVTSGGTASVQFVCTFVLPAALEGVWDFEYVLEESNCPFDEGGLEPFIATADVTVQRQDGEIRLSFLFQVEGAQPIEGTFDPATGEFEGTTGPVDIGGGVEYRETWTGTVVFETQTAEVEVVSEFRDAETQELLCVREFTAEGQIR